MKHSAGLLAYRRRTAQPEVFLVHPGGPFWAKKDEGAWSIPKGEFDEQRESALDAARREFHEETGLTIRGEFHPLEPVKQPGGKMVHAWAVETDFDASVVRSNAFTLEWPPRSGRMREYPEVDRAGWFALDEARTKLLKSQRALLDQLERLISINEPLAPAP